MMNNFQEIKHKLSLSDGIKRSFWFEWKAIVQNKSSIYSNISFPIVYYIFFVNGLSRTIGNLLYDGREISYLLYSLTGLMGIICAGEITNVIYRTVIDNRWGLLHMKMVNGVGTFSYCVGKSLYGLVSINIQIPILLLITYFSKSGIGFHHILTGYFFCIIMVLFWTNLGIAIALKINSYKVRDMITGVALLPIYFSAPAYYIVDDVGFLIRFFSYLNSLTYQLNGLREIMLFSNFNLDVIILICMTVLSFILNISLLKNIKFERSEI